MEYRTLGRTDLKVSELCLGTMTWGSQNTEAQAHEQLDYAFANGINFLDAAEMYPVPSAAKYQGDTERFIGSWLKKRGNRDQVIIATKVTGPGESVAYIRDNMKHNRAHIRAAIEGNLQRLGTDYIDLYQLHWPDRATNFFGQLDYAHDPQQPGTDLLETLSELSELVSEGLVRHIGVSNETPWGVMKFLALAEAHSLPRIATIQNPYSLLNRSLEVGLSEVMMREQVSLLAYSPLAFGVLSGKYLDGKRPANARLTLYPGFSRYLSEVGSNVTRLYVELAKDHGLDPAQMALAFVNSRPFLGSNIIGATNLDQLKSNISSAALKLNEQVLQDLQQIHKTYPNPCP